MAGVTGMESATSVQTTTGVPIVNFDATANMARVVRDFLATARVRAKVTGQKTVRKSATATVKATVFVIKQTVFATAILCFLEAQTAAFLLPVFSLGWVPWSL